MNGFSAIVLVCLASIPADECTEDNATDVMSIHVDNELGCTQGWQDIIARSAQAYDVGHDVYLRTLCRRAR